MIDNKEHDEYQNTPKPPPYWLIQTCRWLWKWQGIAWVACIGDIVANSISSLITSPFPLSISLHGTLLEWLYMHFYVVGFLVPLEYLILVIARYPVLKHMTQMSAQVKPSTLRMSKRLQWRIIGVFFLLSILLFTTLRVFPTLVSTFTPTGLGLHQINSGEYYGICDGSCSFDMQRLDGQLKLEAQHAFQAHQSALGCSYLDWAREYDTTDAEANIYYEDQQCKRDFSGHSITYLAIVAHSTNERTLNYNRDLMQGLYVAQKEYNDRHPVGTHIKILLAAGGDPSEPGKDITQQSLARQISQLQQTQAIDAIVGLPFGFDTLTNALSTQGIPIISIAPTSSSNAIPNYLSIVPSLQDEASSAVKYMNESFHAKKVTVVYNSTDIYSVALEKAFHTAWKGSLVSILDYADSSSYSIDKVVQDLIDNNPDLVYFTGPAEDAGLMMEKLQEHHITAKFMGGDNIYQFVHAPQVSKAEFNTMYFTSYAFPDEWRAQKVEQEPVFINEYKQAFDPDQTHSGNPYTYTRADSIAILSYDAALLLNKSTENIQQLTPATLWLQLLQYTPQQPFTDGLSGQISFTSGSSTPNNKAVLVLQIQSGTTHSIAIEAGYFK